jgi:hypothetical protein
VRRWGRGGGVIDRASPWPSMRYVNDGGHDAPLTPHGRNVYRAALLGVSAAFTLLLILALHYR